MKLYLFYPFVFPNESMTLHPYRLMCRPTEKKCAKSSCKFIEREGKEMLRFSQIIQMSSMHHQLSPSCVLPAFEAARDLTVHHDKTSSGENSGMSDIYALFFLCCAGGKIPEGFFHVVALQSKRLLNLWLPISEFGQPAYAVGMIL
nr:hypothetical protein BgiMline_024345 [Biomphalaria glabrata]